MSQAIITNIETNAANITPAQMREVAQNVFDAHTGGLVTYDNKGNQRGFIMSIGFASKDERVRVMAELFAKQCSNGDYGNLMREVLKEKIVSVAQAEIIEMMLGKARRPSKETARQFCAVIEGVQAKAKEKAEAKGVEYKEPKGKKMVLINMVGELSALIGKEDTTADDAARTIQG
jgi:hypothetical protein